MLGASSIQGCGDPRGASRSPPAGSSRAEDTGLLKDKVNLGREKRDSTFSVWKGIRWEAREQRWLPRPPTTRVSPLSRARLGHPAAFIWLFTVTLGRGGSHLHSLGHKASQRTFSFNNSPLRKSSNEG